MILQTIGTLILWETCITGLFGTKEKAFSFLNALNFVLKASNIGDVRTLVIHPASTIYAHLSAAEKFNAGVTDDLIRISVGIEDITDLLDAFGQALSICVNGHLL